MDELETQIKAVLDTLWPFGCDKSEEAYAKRDWAKAALLRIATPPPGHVRDGTVDYRLGISSLPVTKDGVVVFPEASQLWHPNEQGGNRDGVADWNENDGVVGEFFEYIGPHNEYRTYPINECYADRQAAEAARKDRP